MTIIDGYDRRKNPRQVNVRPMTLEEVKGLRYGSHAKIIANDGKLRDVKINGTVKTWKTRPNEVRVSVKYGMYEYAQFDTQEALARFVVEESSSEGK